MPHPIKLFGNCISYLEKKLNKKSHRVIKGAMMSVFLILTVYISFFALKRLIGFNLYLDLIISSVFIFYGLANKSLIHEVVKVNRELNEKGLEAGRQQLSFIVGRDTSSLDENSIRKASLETLAENLSDGVIAPLLYLFIGGFPLMFAYKMVNTLDSMIGYRNDRYKNFGMVAARIDDIFNYIPARITALLIAMVSLSGRSFRFILKYGKAHSSPNAGFPESAMAGALDCQFGGPSEYFNKLVDKPYIGLKTRLLTFRDVKYACGLNLKSSILFLIIGIVSLYFFHY